MSDVASPDWDLLSSFGGLISLALISIYAGAHGSLSTIKDKNHRDHAGSGSTTDDEDEEEEIEDRLSTSEAYLFPVFGSVVLFGLYMIIKYVGKEWINWLMQWYFTITGVGSVSKVTRRSALMTDILALSFSHNALSLLKLDSFKTGCILLTGLFLYDIWWVFGTEVMVKVATTLDKEGFTMLGLGDVVIPGMFVSLALRYDQHRASVKSAWSTFSKPYFFATLTGYALGLITTMFVMHTFKAAQPALLYLSPACILSFLLTALTRGELKDAWAWSDEPQDSNTSESHEPVKNGHANGASEAAEMNGNSSKTTNGLTIPKVDGELSDASSQGDDESKSLRRRTKRQKKTAS
ncbi:hypothetical protein QCA50_004250 [Cerrena zonata]|uniref:Minor histocompatibility antigen H13 n=1 Tax=Cerrena zonata TaxID=2478898 RepID=A0AAW0GGQ9_9APHY